MEKTIEEIRPIVLAYCNAICKTMDDSVYWSEDQTVNIHGSDDTYIATCGGVVVPIRPSMQDRIWLAAYRLFALETRDAVADTQKQVNSWASMYSKMEDISIKLQKQLEAEQAKTSKLVEALESANDQYSNLCHDVARAALRDHESKDLWQMVEDYKLESYHESAREVMKLTIMHNEDKALEAHRKGGVQG